jgi:RibD C-terminal domain
VSGDQLGKAVQQLKRQSGKGLFVGGVKLPLALAELGLIDEYEFVVQPKLAGHGPTLFAGLSKHVDLKLVSRLEFRSGAVAMRYQPGTKPSGLLTRVGRVGTKDTDTCLTVVANLAAALEIPAKLSKVTAVGA